MCVQQIGSAVKCHDGLARTWATLHNKHTSLWRANDFILLCLNGGNDVAQLTSTTATKCGEQCAVSTKSLTWIIAAESFIVSNTKVTFAKQLIFECQQLRAFNNKMTTTQQAHWFATSSAIKRFSNGCAPVDNNWFTICICHCKSADVKTLYVVTRIGSAIDATKHQCGISQFQLFQTMYKIFVKYIALEASLKSSARARRCQFTNLECANTACFQALIGMQDVCLLLL